VLTRKDHWAADIDSPTSQRNEVQPGLEAVADDVLDRLRVRDEHLEEGAVVGHRRRGDRR
jgi:hypothetical protein